MLLILASPLTVLAAEEEVAASAKFYGTFWSLVPPLVAIALALITKEVISSLMLGILSGGLIYAVFSGGGLVAMSSIAFEIMAKTVGTMDKFYIILFLALLAPWCAWSPRPAVPMPTANGLPRRSKASGRQNWPPVFWGY